MSIKLFKLIFTIFLFSTPTAHAEQDQTPTVNPAKINFQMQGVKPSDKHSAEIRELLFQESIGGGDIEIFDDESQPADVTESTAPENNALMKNTSAKAEKLKRANKVNGDPKLLDQIIYTIFNPGDTSLSEIRAAIELLGASQDPKAKKAIRNVYNNASDLAAHFVPWSSDKEYRQNAQKSVEKRIKDSVMTAVAKSADPKFKDLVEIERKKYPKKSFNHGDHNDSLSDPVDEAERAIEK